jgi:hypothetical protein
MKRVSSVVQRDPSEVPLIPPVAAILSLGMIIPEYWLILVACALLVMTTLAVVQKVLFGAGLLTPLMPQAEGLQQSPAQARAAATGSSDQRSRTLIPANLH